MANIEKKVGMLKDTGLWSYNLPFSFASFIDLVILEQQIIMEVRYSSARSWMRGQYFPV